MSQKGKQNYSLFIILHSKNHSRRNGGFGYQSICAVNASRIIISLLKKDGLLFFESQATDVQNKFIKAVKFGPKVKVIEDRFIILERKKVKSDYPTNIPHREFLVCKKK